MKRERKAAKNVATITDFGGLGYREITPIIQNMGFKMSHTNVMHTIQNIMLQIADEVSFAQTGERLSYSRLSKICRKPSFQAAVGEVLHLIEGQRREEQSKIEKS